MRSTDLTQKKMTWVELEAPVRNKNLSENHQEKDKTKKKLVQTEDGQKVNLSPSDSYLGWQNQKVDRETVSRNKQTRLGAHEKNKNSISKDHSDNPITELSTLGLKMFSANSPSSRDEPNWASSTGRPEDYVPGIAESDRTALNTKEYRFYGYFQRIRERLDRAWTPILRQKLMSYYLGGRRLASDMNHTTKILVILNGAGEIIKVQLTSESGTRDLDEAAIAAFKKAGPFPNPPRNMIDINGEVRVPWDFVLRT